MINVRINSDSRRPWEGIAPLAQAAASGQLAARLASSLGDEASVAVARILPVAQGAGANLANQLSQAIGGELPGRLAFPESQMARGRRRSVKCAAKRFWRDADRLGFAHLRAAALRAHAQRSVRSLRRTRRARESGVCWPSGS